MDSASATSHFPLLALSDELLEQVLSSCDAKDLCHVMQSCKRLRRVVRQSETVWAAAWSRRFDGPCPGSWPIPCENTASSRSLRAFKAAWHAGNEGLRLRRAAKRLILTSREQELRGSVHLLRTAFRLEAERQESIRRALKENLKERYDGRSLVHT